jgi:hypothetical protein
MGAEMTADTKDSEQVWIDEVQLIVSEFVQNDNDLGKLMLDHSSHYWADCFAKGLTPRQALDGYIKRLQTTDMLGRFKASAARQTVHIWFSRQFNMIERLMIILGDLPEHDQANRKKYRAQLIRETNAIVKRYRAERPYERAIDHHS